MLWWESSTVTYSVCVFVTLGILYAMRMCPSAICDPFGSNLFFHIILINGAIFLNKRTKKRKLLNKKYVLDLLYRFRLKTFLVIMSVMHVIFAFELIEILKFK